LIGENQANSKFAAAIRREFLGGGLVDGKALAGVDRTR